MVWEGVFYKIIFFVELLSRIEIRKLDDYFYSLIQGGQRDGFYA
jgi:hypothetical protein